METTVKESVLINVFEMFVKRLDDLQDSINRMNNYLINEARFKTNDIISGSIFNYPFEIYNCKFDKKRYAYVYIKLLNKENSMTLYDIIWNIWDTNNQLNLTPSQECQQKKLQEFMQKHFGEDKYKEIIEGIKLYLTESESDDKYITCNYHNIDTIYEYLPEYIINLYMTQNENIQEFKSFNHLNYCIGINYVNENEIYVDELLKSILDILKKYNYSADNIEYVKVYGIDYNLHKLITFYDSNISTNKNKRILIAEYVDGLCYCIRDRIRETILDFLISKNTDLPFFEDLDEIAYLLDILRVPPEQDELNEGIVENNNQDIIN